MVNHFALLPNYFVHTHTETCLEINLPFLTLILFNLHHLFIRFTLLHLLNLLIVILDIIIIYFFVWFPNKLEISLCFSIYFLSFLWKKCVRSLHVLMMELFSRYMRMDNAFGSRALYIINNLALIVYLWFDLLT